MTSMMNDRTWPGGARPTQTPPTGGSVGDHSAAHGTPMFRAPAVAAAAMEGDGVWIRSLIERADAVTRSHGGGSGTTSTCADHNSVPTMEEMERRLIQYALHVAGGSVPEAANSLGLSEATIYRKIKKYKLSRVRT